MFARVLRAPLYAAIDADGCATLLMLPMLRRRQLRRLRQHARCCQIDACRRHAAVLMPCRYYVAAMLYFTPISISLLLCRYATLISAHLLMMLRCRQRRRCHAR